MWRVALACETNLAGRQGAEDNRASAIAGIGWLRVAAMEFGNDSHDVEPKPEMGRAGAAGDASAPHLGLGLYIVRVIAEFHGGYAQPANPRDGTGAIVLGTLPAGKIGLAGQRHPPHDHFPSLTG